MAAVCDRDGDRLTDIAVGAYQLYQMMMVAMEKVQFEYSS